MLLACVWVWIVSGQVTGVQLILTWNAYVVLIFLHETIFDVKVGCSLWRLLGVFSVGGLITMIWLVILVWRSEVLIMTDS